MGFAFCSPEAVPRTLCDHHPPPLRMRFALPLSSSGSSRSPASAFRFFLLALLTAGLVTTAGCDLPTESPSFGVETTIEAPILTETTFQVLGTSTQERQVLIDTSRNAWDTLFAATPQDNAVQLAYELDAFRFGSLDEVIPELSISSASFSIGSEDFSGAGKRATPSGAAQVTVTSEGTISFDLPHVTFETSEDYVELSEGRLLIENLKNSFDTDLTSLTITFPDLRTPPYGSADGLTVRFEGSTTDEENYTYPALEAGGSRDQVAIDLAGMRLMPTGGEIDYRIEATAEQLPTSDGTISGSLGADQLSVGRVQAVLDPIWVNVNEDADGDGRLELDQDAEAEVTDVPALEEVSDLLSSLSVAGAALDITLGTNIPVGTDFYLALLGKSDSKDVYLSGKNSLAVSSARADEVDLYGTPGELGPDRLIRFPIPESSSPLTVSSRKVGLRVGPENSNADALLNALPNELRLVAKARVNPSGPQRVTLERPIDLSADVEAQIPIKASGELVTITDRREVDFSKTDALRDTSGTTLESGTIRFVYENGLPVAGSLTAEVLGADEEPIGVELGSEDEPIRIKPAGTEDGLAVQPARGEASVELSAEELDRLHEGRFVDIELTVEAGSATEPVRLQADDTIDISVRGSFALNVKTDGDA